MNSPKLYRRLAVLSVAAFLVSNLALGVASVTVSPASPNVIPPATVSVDIRVDGVSSLHGAHIALTFNNAVLQYVSGADGHFLHGSLGTFFYCAPTVARADSIIIDDYIFGSETVSGSGIVCTLTFKGLRAGVSPLTLSVVALSDVNDASIPSSRTSGQAACPFPSQVYVDQNYTSGSAGGHMFGYDAFSKIKNAIDTVAAAGTLTAAGGTYNESVTLGKDVTLNVSGSPAISSLTVANNATVTLGGTIHIGNTLTLSSGTIVTGANKISVISSAVDAVAITGGSVNGEVERSLAGGSTGPYVFTDLHTRLTPNGLQGAISVSIKSFPGIYPPETTTGAAINRYYSITPSGPLTATLQISYLESELNAIPEANLRAFRYNGSTWQLQGGVVGSADNYVEVSSVSTWSLWTLANIDNPLPIQLASFLARPYGCHMIYLEWKTLSEINNYGFEIERSEGGTSDFRALAGSFVPGNGTTNRPQTYSYIDSSGAAGVLYYRLKQIDLDGTIHYSEAVRVEIVTALNEIEPEGFILYQNYPNPFNPTTQFRFRIGKTAWATLKVYDVVGREIAALVDGQLRPGSYSIQWDARGIPSGVYLYMLISGSRSQTGKLVLLR